MQDSVTARLVSKAHNALVFRRRVHVLAAELAAALPPVSTLLDIGCGDGTISRLISQTVPGLSITGAEFLPRPECAIPCFGFDGVRLPFDDQSFDGCLFVDVLHHSRDPLGVIRDAARVSRGFVVIKDHAAETAFDHRTLQFMDWVGNRYHGVELPYGFLSRAQWLGLYRAAGLEPVKVDENIPLYPFPFSAAFGRQLHFITVLRKIR
jgi:SAM-dependent methyltransferase